MSTLPVRFRLYGSFQPIKNEMNEFSHACRNKWYAVREDERAGLGMAAPTSIWPAHKWAIREIWQPPELKFFPIPPYSVALWNLPNKTRNFLFAFCFGRKSQTVKCRDDQIILSLTTKTGKCQNGRNQYGSKNSKWFLVILLHVLQIEKNTQPFWTQFS